VLVQVLAAPVWLVVAVGGEFVVVGGGLRVVCNFVVERDRLVVVRRRLFRAAGEEILAGLGAAADRSEGLAFGPLDLGGVPAAAAFEVEVLADRVVQQTHGD
jgi:hypothetical protein